MAEKEYPGALAGAAGAGMPFKRDAVRHSFHNTIPHVSRTCGARWLTDNLGGRWFGSYGTAPCPVCQTDRRLDQTALTLSDGQGDQLLLHCKRAGCDFRDILAAIGGSGIGLASRSRPYPVEINRQRETRQSDSEAKSRFASELWNNGQPIEGSHAHSYLRSRGINCRLPETLRFSPYCKHAPSGQAFPAMLAKLEGTDLPAIHRTWLDHSFPRKARVEPAKMMLGNTLGGSVRLSEGHGWLVVCEGIETGLSLLCGFLGGPEAVWAALSASGMRGLKLPAPAGRLTVACDGDAVGRAAAVALAERAHAKGWTVGMMDPGDGKDWNDILTSGVAS